MSPRALTAELGTEPGALDVVSASRSGSASVNFLLVLVTTCVYGPETWYRNQNKNNLT